MLIYSRRHEHMHKDKDKYKSLKVKQLVYFLVTSILLNKAKLLFPCLLYGRWNSPTLRSNHVVRWPYIKSNIALMKEIT